MTTEDPHKDEGGGSPLFQDSRDGGGGTPKVKLAIGGVVALVAAIAIGFALRPEPPPPTAPTATARPAPRPADVPEGQVTRVPGGNLRMGAEDGDADEKPLVDVVVAPFDLDVTEVTVAAYTKCVAAGKCTAPDTGMYCNWKKPGREGHPINCLDWDQATAFCGFVGKRLPTEDEWEHAARGGDGRKYPWGATPPGEQVCWNGDGNDQGHGNRQGTCAVGSYPTGRSPYGPFDMLGNVWEWTASPYCPYTGRDCQSDKRVIRGGGWNNLDPVYVRATDRAKEPVKARPENIGMRCARSPS